MIDESGGIECQGKKMMNYCILEENFRNLVELLKTSSVNLPGINLSPCSSEFILIRKKFVINFHFEVDLSM